MNESGSNKVFVLVLFCKLVVSALCFCVLHDQMCMFFSSIIQDLLHVNGGKGFEMMYPCLIFLCPKNVFFLGF